MAFLSGQGDKENVVILNFFPIQVKERCTPVILQSLFVKHFQFALMALTPLAFEYLLVKLLIQARNYRLSGYCIAIPAIIGLQQRLLFSMLP